MISELSNHLRQSTLFAVMAALAVPIVGGMMHAAGLLAQRSPPPEPQDPVAAIVKLFDQHRVVMLGEIHGSVQFHELLKKLVTSPGFADHVNDIVVELGNSLYQDALDRYIAGENVPIEQLRRSWQDVVGAPNGIPLPPYHGLYATVREVNRTLPADHRLRVLAGDPPINWDRVQTREDVTPFLGSRDRHYASVVRNEVLAKGRKALLIMGILHFQRLEGKPLLIEQQMIESHANPYVIVAGSDIVRAYDDVDARFRDASKMQPWPWLMDMKGSWIGALPRWADLIMIGHPAPSSNGARVGTWAQVADAYLFLGPRDTLTVGGEAFDLEGTPYGDELRRRWKIVRPDSPDVLPKSDGATRPLFQRISRRP